MTEDHLPTHRALRRLDGLGAHLATRGDVVALLGLGSAGVEHERFDDHSDLDFFVVVDEGETGRYVDRLDWLEAPAPLAWSFANERNGRKALYTDGVFVEYAVFTLADLARLPFAGARVVWRRADAPADLEACGPPPAGPPYDTVEFHVGEAVTNLYVGLHRELRGERLTATRFVQSYAVDHLVALLDLARGGERHHRDPFDRTRRVEAAYPATDLPLADLVPGYDHNPAAARAVLTWLAARYPLDPAISTPVEDLLK